MIATIILLFLMVFNLGVTCVKNGQPKEDTYNFLAQLACDAILLWLYYLAGLFECFK